MLRAKSSKVIGSVAVGCVGVCCCSCCVCDGEGGEGGEGGVISLTLSYRMRMAKRSRALSLYWVLVVDGCVVGFGGVAGEGGAEKERVRRG